MIMIMITFRVTLTCHIKVTVHEQYAFMPSDLQNYAFRAGRHAFHRGKNGRICKHAAKFGESTDIYPNL